MGVFCGLDGVGNGGLCPTRYLEVGDKGEFVTREHGENGLRGKKSDKEMREAFAKARVEACSLLNSSLIVFERVLNLCY